jgi:hypothetical protein
MIPRPLIVTVFVGLAIRSFAADSAEAPEQTSQMKEVLRARAAEEAKKQANESAPAAKSSPPSTTATMPRGAQKAGSPTPPASKETPVKPADAPAAARKETPTVLPKVEVNRSKITELDHQLHEQEKEIAREQKNTKPTELDKTLNSPAAAKALSIFGGESSQQRAGVAKERVSLMQEEKDLLEAIAQAKTKEEKAELQQQLDYLKSYRRELEKTLR